MTAGRRDQLASALARTGLVEGVYWELIADALLPTVDRMIRQAQAEAYGEGWRDGHDADCECHPPALQLSDDGTDVTKTDKENPDAR